LNSKRKTVIHWSTLRSGGAFRALEGIHSHLDSSRFDSAILSPPPLEGPATVAQTIQQECVFANRSPLSNSYFSLDLSQHKTPERKDFEIADVLHLHWVADWLDSAFLKSLAALHCPIIWTLHDLRPISGGCHFPAGCREWLKSCNACPQLADPIGSTIARCFTNQKSAVEAIQPIFVAPSRWLYDACRTSQIGRTSRVELIPYGVDHHFFAPGDKIAARRMWNLPLDCRIFLIVAQQISEKRKGYQETITAWKHILQSSRSHPAPTLLCVGETVQELENLPGVVELGFLRDANHIRSVYQAADVFVSPAHEDNLPNVVLEAMASGLPVLASNTGGLPDLVEDGRGGRLLPEISVQSLEIGLQSLLAEDAANLARMGSANRAKIQEKFTLDRQAKAYESLYEEAMIPTDRGLSHVTTANIENLDTSALLNWACQRNRAEMSRLHDVLHEQLRYIHGMEKQLSSNRFGEICGKLVKSMKAAFQHGQ
jgi:glycosyltransferase involved in cell wall biosynthesis